MIPSDSIPTGGSPRRAAARRRTGRRTSKPRLLGDLDEAGRRRHVDLGQARSDDVEADDQQALRPQLRRQRLARSRGRAASAAAPRRGRRRPGCRASRPASGCGRGSRARPRRRSAGCACRRRRSPAGSFCTMTVCRPWRDTVSTITLRLGSDSPMRNTDVPPMPSSGLTTTSSCSSMNCAISAASRVTSVGEMNSANLRDRELLVVVADRARPVEHARAFALRAFEQVRRVHVLHVERRVLAHDHRRELGRAGATRPRLRGTTRGRRRRARAAARAPRVTPASQNRSRCSSANIRCPRRASSRIIAMLESL